ncbi:MAG: hypothetical protein OXG23_03350 [Chloroflexi bacterium]|nr:hypothetical protein [Chloroflexota bacterium]
MPNRTAQLKRTARRQYRLLAIRLDWVIRRLIQIFRWLNAIDIPLSPLQWILLLYLVFGAIYALATPVFEANEEIWHFGYVEHLRQTGSLPQQVFDGRDTIYRQHGSQPPLYYGLMAAATAPFNIEDSDSYRRLNPYVSARQPDSFGNKNLIIHDHTLSLFDGTGLAVLFIRALGLALGAGTIVFVYKIGELVAPQRLTVAFVAAAITGLNPMFIFVSASVNNDSLAMILNGALIWLLLRTLRDGFSLRRTLALALLFALSSLTKLTGLVLLPVMLGLSIFVFRKTSDRRGLLIFLYFVALFWLVIAGWWFFRNVQLYGEPFGIITMANIAGPRDITFSLADWLGEYQQFRMSYWGLFGALNVQVTGVFYLLADLMTFLGIIGCVFLAMQLLAISDFAYARYELAHLLTLACGLALLWLGVLYWSSLTSAAEGRLIFPLIAIVSPLLAVGFVEVVWWIVFSLRPPNLEFVRAGDAVPKELLHNTMIWQLRFLAVVALFVPFTVIASQYNSPQPVDEISDRARPVYAEFGDVALIAYERSDRRYSTGDQVRLKLYWRVLMQSRSDNSIRLSLVDDHGHEIGSYKTFPGAGSLRSSRWQAGLIYPDEYLIRISRAAYGRYPFYLRVEWEDAERSAIIGATSAEGEKIEPVLLNIGAVVTAKYQPSAAGFSEIPPNSQPVFEEQIRLESFMLNLELNEISLNWKSESTPDENFTVFAHLLDSEGNILSQDDNSPRLPTKYWRWGESFTTFHRFDAGFNMLDYTVSVGLYINDGLTYPKLEYTSVVEQDGEEIEEVLDSFEIPWDIAKEVLELTATAAPKDDAAEGETAEPQVTDEASESEASEPEEAAP